MPVQFDWEITQNADDPQRFEPERLPDLALMASDAPPWWHRRDFWLRVLATFTILSIASLVILRRLSASAWEQVREEVAALVKLEEQLALAGDVEALLALQDPGDPGWRTARLSLTESHLPAPSVLPDLTPAGDQLIVRSITAVDQDIVTADVERIFAGPDGSLLRFHGPQFYRRTARSGWVRIAPPRGFWGQPRSWKSHELHIVYLPPDEEAVDGIAEALSQKVSDACTQLALDCALVLPVSLWFSSDPLRILPAPWSVRLVNLNIGNSVPGVILQPGETFLSLPSLQFGQLPADDAARAALSSHLTFQATRFLAQKLYGDTPQAQEVFRQMLFIGGMLPSPPLPPLRSSRLRPSGEEADPTAPPESLAPGTIVTYLTENGQSESLAPGTIVTYLTENGQIVAVVGRQKHSSHRCWGLASAALCRR